MEFHVLAKRGGLNLQRARWRKHMTQEDVAARGFALDYFKDLEAGRRNPSLRMLGFLAGVLGVRLADLLDVGERLAQVKLADVSPDEKPKRGRKPGRVAKR